MTGKWNFWEILEVSGPVHSVYDFSLAGAWRLPSAH
jgi:hypothetical protein